MRRGEDELTRPASYNSYDTLTPHRPCLRDSASMTHSRPDPDFKESGGGFLKRRDSRRHVFTATECSAGFWAGLASYVERGGARGRDYHGTPKALRGRVAA